jgi:hypothetical protein
MSIIKLSSSQAHSPNDSKVRQAVFINMVLITIVLLAALDLLVTSLRGDSLAIYTKFVLSDLILTVVGLMFCSDLIVQKGQKVLSYFLSYMIFLWTCLTIIKLVVLA